MHDGIEIVSRAKGLAVADDDKIRLISRIDITQVDDDVGIAVWSLVLVPKSKRMSNFVANGAAIPGVRAEHHKLLGIIGVGIHPDRRRKSAAPEV